MVTRPLFLVPGRGPSSESIETSQLAKKSPSASPISSFCTARKASASLFPWTILASNFNFSTSACYFSGLPNLAPMSFRKSLEIWIGFPSLLSSGFPSLSINILLPFSSSSNSMPKMSTMALNAAFLNDSSAFGSFIIAINSSSVISRHFKSSSFNGLSGSIIFLLAIFGPSIPAYKFFCSSRSLSSASILALSSLCFINSSASPCSCSRLAISFASPI
mmetsp:Transcript_15611/g.12891  ORF Transcript_15611/g.12891 Transcript_15611/m.12891 type:complete len:219 (+) Transcript_15611:1642-2298(+)